LFENSKKPPKGIDKMKTGFIIRLVGKSGEKRWTIYMIDKISVARVGGFGEN